MNYSRIYMADIANGPGCRVSLFVSGCTHHCKGCFNESTWDFMSGELYTGDTEELIIAALGQEGIEGLTILGGEPMELVNQAGIISLLRQAKAMGKSVWLYSGYTMEELRDKSNKRCHGPYTDEILTLVEVLVDGEFMESKKNISLAYRGSENQRVIHLKDGVPNSIIEGVGYDPGWRGEGGNV